MNALLIVGTDTEVGKTVLTTALAAYWQTYYSTQRLGMLKPIQSGTGDRELYSELFSLNQSLSEITPLYFDAPLAPPIAAEQEGKTVDLAAAWQGFEALRRQRDFVLVEALGGLGSPVTRELTVADLARDWKLPTVLVVPVRLGAISQAVANVALARQSGVNLKGIVLSCTQPRSEEDIAKWAEVELIQTLTQMPVFGIMPNLTDTTNVTALAEVAANLDLEVRIVGGKPTLELGRGSYRKL